MTEWLITVHITLDADDQHQALARLDQLLEDTNGTDLEYEATGIYHIVLPDPAEPTP